jgi:hypothetical protein
MAGSILVKPGETVTVVGIPADAPLPPYIPGPVDPGYSPPWAQVPDRPPVAGWPVVPGWGGSLPGGGGFPGQGGPVDPGYGIPIDPPIEPPPVKPPSAEDGGHWVWAWSPQAGRWVWVRVPGEGEAGPK